MADNMTIQQAQLRSLLEPSRVYEGALQKPVQPAAVSTPQTGPSFADTLRDSIQEVNRLQIEAEQMQEDLVTGKNPDVHGTMIAMQKADVSFRLMMEVRSKIVDAYKEVMRMQV